MKPHELLHKVETILEDVKAGILASTDENGKPTMRWLMPALLKGRNGSIYAISSPSFKWVRALENHPHVQWMIQTKALNEIIHLKGQIRIVDNPSLKSEVMQAIGNKLTVFWKVNTEKLDFIVLETAITEGTYFLPMHGEKSVIPFESI